MKKIIKEIYLLDQDKKSLESQYALDNWYSQFINKSVDDINVQDISRMLSQNILIDLGIEKAIEMLRSDPLSGEKYEGHLLEVLYSVETYDSENTKKIRLLLYEIKEELFTLEWGCNEDREEYNDLLTKFINKLNNL